MKLKIAFFTPLNPLKSGVSDFSEELLMELKNHMEIELFIGDYTPTNPDIVDNFTIRKIKDFVKEEIRSQYDEVIYQIGNNEVCHKEIYDMALKYPGIIEIHDISLHHMIAATTIAKGNIEEYKRIMEYCHGKNAVKVVDQFLNSEILPPWENNSLTFTLNKEIIDSAKGVIVHSDYAKQMVKGIKSDVKITTIYLHADEICTDYEKEKIEARKKMGIDIEETIFATFGFITKPKRIFEILKVLKEIKYKGYAFKFYIVGKVDENLNILNIIRQYGLQNDVIVTGFVDLTEMKNLMKAADICFCLRYPTQGESSAIVHRLLGMGKVIIVTDVGTFSEYPDEIIIKINHNNEIEMLIEEVEKIMKNKSRNEDYSINSLKFALENIKLQDNSLKYMNFIESNALCYEHNIDELIADQLYQMNIIDDEIIRAILDKN